MSTTMQQRNDAIIIFCICPLIIKIKRELNKDNLFRICSADPVNSSASSVVAAVRETIANDMNSESQREKESVRETTNNAY